MIKYKDKITGKFYIFLAHATLLYGDKCENVIVYHPDDNQHNILVMNYTEFGDKYEEKIDESY